MNAQSRPRSLLWSTAIVLLLSVLIATSALAEGSSPPAGALFGGRVLAPWAAPYGWSLAEAATATAYFNVGSRDPSDLPADFPFQILYTPDGNPNSFSVEAGTVFYVPVVYSDDTDAALWPYPDVTDPAAVSAYYFDPDQLGAEFIRITVDGRVRNLGPRYAAGAVTPGLPTGGNNYTTVAAFLSPMSKGTHEVKIAFLFSGAFIALHPDFFPDGTFGGELTYMVTVR